MLSMVLKILSILGILLLCLFGVVIVILLLVLFFPIGYKLSGKKDPEQMLLCARASWLFGILRVSFHYPDPGGIIVKVLFFTVFDSGKVSGDKKKTRSGGGSAESAGKEGKGKRQKPPETGEGKGRKQSEAAKKGKVRPEAESERERKQPDVEAGEGRGQSEAETESGRKQPDSKKNALFEKIKKLKYTICSIYDKIKNIWENISYYIELLREEETKQLFSHAVFRLGKILKSIRPRRIRGQILFGLGSPDTTGYAYGVYGMLSPCLGRKLLVTPDFTQAVLEGDICVSGHITVFTILWNGLRVLLDRKLRRFIKKMKAGRKV